MDIESKKTIVEVNILTGEKIIRDATEEELHNWPEALADISSKDLSLGLKENNIEEIIPEENN